MGADALGVDKAAELEAQMIQFRDRATAADAENMRLEWELAKARRDLTVAEDALNAMEEDREQAARLVPDPGEFVGLRSDWHLVRGLSVPQMDVDELAAYGRLEDAARTEP